MPPLIWALVSRLSRPPENAAARQQRADLTSLFAAVAKETPWIAVVGAGLAGAANMFLNRNKSKK